MSDSQHLSALINMTTSTSTLNLTAEATTSVYENREAKAMRRLIYFVLHGIVGLLIAMFNGFVILAYAKREKIRRHISMVLMNLFVFCFFHGLIVGIVYPLQRVYRYKMNSELCILTTLIMDFADNYILVLLPVLAIERLMHLKYPNLSPRKIKLWSIGSIIASLFVTLCYAWLPLIPDLNIPMADQWSHDNQVRQKEISRFYQHYTCQFRINKKNTLEPIFNILIGTICVTIVISVYVTMFCMLRSRLSEYSSMMEAKKTQLRKAALSVMLVAITFIFTLLPFGITIQIATFCDKDTTNNDSSVCNGMTLELRFVFSIIAHLGNLLAPLLFTMLNVNIRQSLLSFIKQATIQNPKSGYAANGSKDIILNDTTTMGSITCISNTKHISGLA